MKAKIWIRIAAVCMLFFALGHTAGHITRHTTDDVRAKEVIKAMTDYKRDMFGAMRSFDENYTGMSLNLIATLLILTVVLWILSNLATSNPRTTAHLLIPVLLCAWFFAVTGFMYFFLLPAITCLLAGLSLSVAGYRLYSKRQ